MVSQTQVLLSALVSCDRFNSLPFLVLEEKMQSAEEIFKQLKLLPGVQLTRHTKWYQYCLEQ